MTDIDCSDYNRPSIKRILTVTSLPAVAVYVVPWVSIFSKTPLASHIWIQSVESLIQGLCAALVLPTVGIAFFISLSKLKSWSIKSTIGSLVCLIICLGLRFVVTEYLADKATVEFVRDFIWGGFFVLMVVVMFLSALLWSIYLWRHGFSD